MKSLFTLLMFIMLAGAAFGQTQADLPPGSTPFGQQYWKDPAGNIWGGSSFNGYTNLGNWERVVDSLGIKLNKADSTLYATQWDLQNIPTPDYPVESVTGTLVDDTDPKNPVINTPTAADVGALAPGDNVSELTNDAGYLTTETDPTVPAPVKAITQTDINNWNAKQAAITGAATTITTANLTVNRAVISNSSGKIAVSPVTSTQLGYLAGVTGAIQTQLNSKLDTAEVGASGGVAPLGDDGKVPSEYLPTSGSYKGTWDAATNTPTLADGVGVNGDRYRVSVGGTVDLGSGDITFVAGDDVIYNGTVWQRSPSGVTVTSVAGKTGDVVLAPGDVQLGSVNNTSDLNKPISIATQNALDGKEDAFSKGNLVAGSNITLTGTLASRLVGAGNVTVNVDAGSIGIQTLSLGSTAGNIAISGGNNISLNSILRQSIPDYAGFIGANGLFPFFNTSGTGYPVAAGAGLRLQTSAGLTSLAIYAPTNGDKVYYNKNNDPAQWKTFASEEWVNALPGLSPQTLSLTSAAGQFAISGGNAISLSSISRIVYGGDFSDFPLSQIGLFHYANSTGSTGYPSVFGNGIRMIRESGSTNRAIDINRSDNGSNSKLKYNLGTSGTAWKGWETFASEEYIAAQPFGTITQTDIDNWNEAAANAAPETVITTTVNFTINWQTDIAPGSTETYATLHGNHFLYNAYFTDAGAEVNYSPAVKIIRSGANITTVEFVDVLTGKIIIK